MILEEMIVTKLNSDMTTAVKGCRVYLDASCVNNNGVPRHEQSLANIVLRNFARLNRKDRFAKDNCTSSEWTLIIQNRYFQFSWKHLNPFIHMEVLRVYRIKAKHRLTRKERFFIVVAPFMVTLNAKSLKLAEISRKRLLTDDIVEVS